MQVMSSPFVLGVDLDGTCADFYTGLRPIAAEWLGVAEQSLGSEFSWDLPEWGVARAPGGYPKLHQFAVLQRDLFRILKPMPGAPQVLRRLSDMGVRIRIITHRLLIKNFHRVAVQQTVDWLDGHDIPYWDLCFLADKSAVGADLYVEDSPKNVEQLRREGHPTIVFTSPTNRHLPGPRADTWEQVYEMVVAAMEREASPRA
jgi:5'(3')-deoxyribonucleotidase